MPEPLPPSPATPSPRALWLGSALVVVLVALVYGQTVDHDFVSWDDPGYLLGNPHVNQGVSVDDAVWAFTRRRAANWHPLTWISHQIDVDLFGFWAGGHHLMSAALHAAGAVLLLLALVRMTGRFGPALFVAALFAVHPLRVESVAWASERKDVLSGLFFMATLLAWTSYLRRPSTNGLLLAGLTLACGLMSKPMLVTAPFVLLLLDAWPLGRWRGVAGDGGVRGEPASSAPGAGLGLAALVREKALFFALAAATVGATLWAQGQAGAVMSLDEIPAEVRLVNIPLAYLGYLGKAVWPVDLALFYPLPEVVDAALITRSALALGALALVTGMVVLRRRRDGASFTGWLMFLGMLVPVIGIVQVGSQSMADRYAYLPLVGIEVLVAFGVARCLAGRPALERAGASLAVVVVCALALRAHDQVGVWSGNVSLYTHALAIDPENPAAHNNLGIERVAAGDRPGAIASFEQAVEHAPGFAQAWLNLGTTRRLHGDLAGARAALDRAQDLEPGTVQVIGALAMLLADEGKLDKAARRVERLLELAPRRPDTHIVHGHLLTAGGRTHQAAEAYREALRLDPDHAEAARRLAELDEPRGP